MVICSINYIDTAMGPLHYALKLQMIFNTVRKTPTEQNEQQKDVLHVPGLPSEILGTFEGAITALEDWCPMLPYLTYNHILPSLRVWIHKQCLPLKMQ